MKKELSDPRPVSEKTMYFDQRFIDTYISELETIQPRVKMSYWEQRRIVFGILYSPTVEHY